MRSLLSAFNKPLAPPPAPLRKVDPNKERLFALGVVVGAVFGFALGSMVALRVGEDGVWTLRRAVERAIGHDDRPKFELFLQ